MANNQLDLGKVSAVEGEDLSVLEHVTYNSAKNQLESDKPLVELMNGYSFVENDTQEGVTRNIIYAGVVKNGNKLTLVLFGEITRTAEVEIGYLNSNFEFGIPQAIANKLYPNTIGGVGDVLSDVEVSFIPEDNYTTFTKIPCLVFKYGQQIVPNFYNVNASLTLNKKYTFRLEQTFLLSDNLVS